MTQAQASKKLWDWLRTDPKAAVALATLTDLIEQSGFDPALAEYISGQIPGSLPIDPPIPDGVPELKTDDVLGPITWSPGTSEGIKDLFGAETMHFPETTGKTINH